MDGGLTEGIITRRLTVGDLSLTESVYPAGLAMAMHGHQPAYLSAVLAGGFSECCGYTTDEVGPRALVWHDIESEHAVRFGPMPTKIFRVEVGRPWLEKAALQRGKLNVPSEASWCVARLYREFRDASCELAIESCFVDLVGWLQCTSAPRDSGKARAARHFLRERYRQPISLQDAAASLDIHPVYLARTFRETYGYTVGYYVRRLRLTFASSLIVDTEMPLGEVALEAGFSDQAHLTKAFRAIVGVTPASYRRTHRVD